MDKLLRKAIRGDADAFGELCGPFEGLVYRHCLQMLRHSADAEDAAQETMLRAYRSIASFKGESSVATWLYRIAHNVCLDHLKKPRLHREGVSLDAMRDAGFDPATEEATPEASDLGQAEQERLREAILCLPDETQALLALRYGDGLAYDQLAETFGLNPGTVKSKLSRAKDRLREILKQD